MTNLDGYDLLNDAYARIITDRGADEGWVPSRTITDYDLETAIDDATMDTGDHNRALFEILLAGYLEGDPVWQEIEEAATRALAAFAAEMDEEAASQGITWEDDGADW